MAGTSQSSIGAVQSMWLEFKTRKARAALISILALGFLLRLLVVIQPVNVLVEKNLPDDAYYYFVIAHQTFHSNSVSLDGESVTNGFHPLWWLILLPIFGWDVNLSDMQVHLALGLAALFDVVAIWAIGQIAARLGRSERIGILAAFLYCANPIAILQATNGLETAIAMGTLSVFLWLLLRLLTDADNRRILIGVGIFLGLAFLARSDSIFTLGIALLGAWCYWGFRQGLYRVVGVTLIAGLLILPWFIWGYLYTGSLVQESGIAVPFAIRHRLILDQGAGLFVVARETVQQLTQPMLWLRGDPTGLPFAIGIILWILALIGLARRWKYAQITSAGEKIILTSLLGGGLLLLIFHAGIRFYPRIWYFSPMAIAFSLVAALVLESISNSKRLYFYTILLITSYFAISGFIIWNIGYYPWQREMLAANRWLTKNTSPGDKIGSFNSGIYAYYSDRQVVNLDGVVNHYAFEAIKSFNILNYLNQQNISYILDYDSAIKGEYQPFMGTGYPQQLKEIAILGGRIDSPLGLLRIYQVIPK